MFAQLAVIALTLAGVSAAPAAVQQTQVEKRDSFSGQATYFEAGLGACGWESSDSDYIVALNAPQYADGGMCGQMVTIQNNENGNQVQAKIVDECPGCAWGSLDMSPAVFGDLNNGNYDEGVFPITWWQN